MEVELEPLDLEIDHVRGPEQARVILEYGDFECPYSRRAFREFDRLERWLDGELRFAFRHFPLTWKHPHAWAASAAAEAAALQDRFWEMYALLFTNQRRLKDDDLRRYAGELGLDLDRFDSDRTSELVTKRIDRDVGSGITAGVEGTPALFIDGRLHEGNYDARSLMEALGARTGGAQWPA